MVGSVFGRIPRAGWFVVAAVALVLLAGLALHLFRSSATLPLSQTVGPEKGKVAPDFSARSPDGGNVTLADFRGKPLVLNFFATWCGPCKAEAPELEAAYRRAGGSVAFVGVTFQDTAASVRVFAAEHSQSFPLLLDDSGEIGRLYNVRGLPTTFFIRPDGVVHYVVKGPMTREFLALELEILGGK